MTRNEMIDVNIDSADIIVDFQDVLFLRKVNSKKSFDSLIYKELLHKKLLLNEVGQTNYCNLRRWHFDQLTSQLINKEELLNVELNMDRSLLFLNPYLKLLISRYKKIYVYNNTDYSIQDVITLIQASLSEELYRNVTVIGEITELTHAKDTMYLTSENREITNVQVIQYDLSVKDDIDLESMLYDDPDQRFYMLRKAISQDSKLQDIYFKIGSLYVGPLLLSFIKLVVDDLCRKNIPLVFSLMREGELIHSIMERYITKRKLPIQSVKCYVSRKATYLPALYKNSSGNKIFDFFEGIKISVQDLYNLFSLGDIDFSCKHENLYTIKKNDRERYENIKKDFLNKVSDSKVSDLIQEKRTLLLQYLDQIANNNKRVATIDIGFNGTIQENLDTLSMGITFEHYLLFGREGLLNKIISGMKVNSFINSSDYAFVKDILRGVQALEQIIIASEGSTLDYESAHGIVSPIKEKLELSSEEIRARTEIQNGVKHFVDMALNANLEEDIHAEDLRRSAKSIHRLINFPTKQEAVAIGNLNCSTNFGSMEQKAIIDRGKLASYGVEDIYQSLKGSNLSSDIIWPQGILASKDPEYIYKNLIDKDLYSIFSKLKSVFSEEREVSVVIYGAGEAARKVYQTVKIKSIVPLYFVDKNVRLHNTEIEGIRVIPPTSLLDKSIDYIVIASYTFGAEIENELRERYSLQDNIPKFIRIDE